MKASELRPGQFFVFVLTTQRYRRVKHESRCVYYIDAECQLHWCAPDLEVVAVAGWDDEPESEAKQLNIDSGDEKFELARALHRVVRAMHDGHCPKCGHLASSMEFEPSEGYHCCPECLFAITKEEADEALAMFLPYMQKNYDKFAAWQLHGRFVKPITSTNVLTGEKTQWEFATPELREQFCRDAKRYDSAGRDVTGLNGLHDESDTIVEPFKAGDLVVCDRATLQPRFGVKAYKVNSVHIGETVDWLELDGILGGWSVSRFRHATAAEIAAWKAEQEPKPLQLAEGKYYERRDGEIVGPVKLCRDLREPWEYIVAGYSYRSDGTQAIEDEESEADLIREVPPPASVGTQPEHAAESSTNCKAESASESGEQFTNNGCNSLLEAKRQDDEGWIANDGFAGGPVAGDVKVDVKYRSGSVVRVHARNAYWDIQEKDDDITHYRVVEQVPAKPEPQGTEARVCQDIAERQALGVNKYGTTVEKNPLCLLEWLEHAYQECLDQAVYLKRAMEEIDRIMIPCGVEANRTTSRAE